MARSNLSLRAPIARVAKPASQTQATHKKSAKASAAAAKKAATDKTLLENICSSDGDKPKFKANKRFLLIRNRLTKKKGLTNHRKWMCYAVPLKGPTVVRDAAGRWLSDLYAGKRPKTVNVQANNPAIMIPVNGERRLHIYTWGHNKSKNEQRSGYVDYELLKLKGKRKDEDGKTDKLNKNMNWSPNLDVKVSIARGRTEGKSELLDRQKLGGALKKVSQWRIAPESVELGIKAQDGEKLRPFFTGESGTRPIHDFAQVRVPSDDKKEYTENKNANYAMYKNGVDKDHIYMLWDIPNERYPGGGGIFTILHRDDLFVRCNVKDVDVPLFFARPRLTKKERDQLIKQEKKRKKQKGAAESQYADKNAFHFSKPIGAACFIYGYVKNDGVAGNKRVYGWVLAKVRIKKGTYSLKRTGKKLLKKPGEKVTVGKTFTFTMMTPAP